MVHYEPPLVLLQAARRNLSKALQRSLLELIPKAPISTEEWIEKNFKLPKENSDTPGDFDFYYVPHLYGILAAFDDPQVTDVYCLKGSQIAWTTILVAYILSLIDQRPVPIIGMFSAVDAAREFSVEKLKPFVTECKALAGKLDVSSTRRTGNGLLHREFPGGFLKLIGSNAVRSMKSTPAPVLFVEEPDDAAENAQGQGDSVTILYERSKRFRRSKVKRILGGTASVKDFSRVEARIKMSDESVLPIRCHGCAETHVLDFGNVTWLDSDEGQPEHPIFGKALPETAVYNCPHCGEIWNDNQRRDNIRNTVSDARAAGDKFCGWMPTRPGIKAKGFTRLGELYSCLPGSSLAEMVEKHLEAEYYFARGDETKKISFVNNQLGKPYEYKDGRPDADHFRELAREDPESQRDELVCPAAGLLVTAGIDVQHDRLAVVLRAWGRDDKCWLIYWGEIAASSSCVDKKDPVWDALDSLIFQAFKHESGASIFASAISIDSSDGTTSDAVYHWVRSRQKRHRRRLIMAIKGSSSLQDPEIFTQPRKKSIDHKHPDRQTKADRHGVKVYMVGTNKAKDWLTARMALGPGGGFHYYHAEQMRWDYFDQMCGEAKIPHKTIRNRRVWQQKSGQAVEAWDCEGYALHAARAKKVHLLKPNEWDALERQLVQPSLFKTAEEQDGPAPRNKKQSPRRQANGGYVDHEGPWV